MKTLILGGARSGKSRYAEQLASASDCAVTYVATAEAGDTEMAARITHHQQQRPSHWVTREVPLDLAGVIASSHGPGQLILVDCLTLWLSNCLAEGTVEPRQQQLLAALSETRARVILVSNEVGSGVVPLGQLSREFVDCSGRLHQQLAALCDTVTLIVAGLPLPLKTTESDNSP